MQYRQIIITTIILLLFAVIGTTLVAVTFERTRDQIAANERATLLRKLHRLIAPEQHDNVLLEDTLAVRDEHPARERRTGHGLPRPQGRQTRVTGHRSHCTGWLQRLHQAAGRHQCRRITERCACRQSIARRRGWVMPLMKPAPTGYTCLMASHCRIPTAAAGPSERTAGL